jgi:hypothetical protein
MLFFGVVELATGLCMLFIQIYIVILLIKDPRHDIRLFLLLIATAVTISLPIHSN